MSLESTVVVVGVGLIGGSVAAAVRKYGVARNIVGLGRSRARLQTAVDAGLLDAAIDRVEDIPADTSLVVVCTPVDRIAQEVRRLLPALRSGAIITDAGSTKVRVCEQLADLANQPSPFLGSHPIAGSEKQGSAHADADLFQGRACVITPLPKHPAAIVSRVEQFWQGLGMTTARLSPADHDQILARTSHVPHAVAAATAASVRPSDFPWIGSGFRDTTRIAAGDAELWTAIFRENRQPVLAGLATVRHQLETLEDALKQDDVAAIQTWLQHARQLRDAVPAPSPRRDAPMESTVEDT